MKRFTVPGLCCLLWCVICCVVMCACESGMDVFTTLASERLRLLVMSWWIDHEQPNLYLDTVGLSVISCGICGTNNPNLWRVDTCSVNDSLKLCWNFRLWRLFSFSNFNTLFLFPRIWRENDSCCLANYFFNFFWSIFFYITFKSSLSKSTYVYTV
jgi:hypothetical protein